MFAAVHGNMIQLYNTWTFENIGTLKGHNGKVKSLSWSANDNLLVSGGTDGAVYVWNVRELKRENEYILKSCAFSSVICNPSGNVVYAVGSDKMVKV
jgi:WD40 repeat protein